MGDFSALNTALSGLLAHRRALDVIGHNISNVSTEGFSRRRVDLGAISVGNVPGRWSTAEGVGGVEVKGVTRIRDEFLEARALREHGTSERVSAEAAALARIESALPEPSDLGLARQLSDFWAGWDDVANSPSDLSARTALLTRAGTVVDTLHRVSAELWTLRDDQLAAATALVSQVNGTAARIADLNHRIAEATSAGLAPHDLSDERDQLVLELSQLVGVTTREADFGQVDVFLGGTALVRDNRAEQVRMVETGPLPAPYTATGLQRAELQWVADGATVRLGSGRIAGMLNAVDGHVPQALAELDGVAASMVTAVNALHVTGQGLDPVNDVNLDFFDPAGVTASTIALSADVAGQPQRLAVATAGGGALDASVAQALAALGGTAGGPDATYRTMIGRIAITAQATERQDRVQADVVRSADDARTSVSGVNLDEELANLVQSQRAYEASARLLTTVDETLDTLINRTGVVGR